ncbi:cilia- and flagella-associated protein 97 [Gadus chalcogrammus]|uniref:cilia- and flagella-associated protein 97 n=1 Tax=Gadus chalcogrammus TaxID=1042646 RepID=UPI0024C3EBAC|nr:cilia- and flagella-associated protein 97 [Gadus chalcogrammus]
MFTPRDLDGEVDHSFFDSESEYPSKHGTKTEKETVTTVLSENKSSQPQDARQEGRVDRCRPTPGGIQVVDRGPRAELEKISRASSSSIGYTSDNAVGDGANTMRPESNAEAAPYALSSDEKQSDGEDGYYQSQDESEDEETQTRLSRKSSGANLTSPKKLVRKRTTRSASPSSTDTDTDTYTSSSDSSDASSSLEPSSSTMDRSRALIPPSSSLGKGGEPGGLGSSSSRGVDRPPTPLRESEDTATDVTPLSTPGLVSPIPGFDLAARVGKVTLEEEQRIRGPTSVASSDAPQEDQGFGSNLDEPSLGLDSKLVVELLLHHQQQQQQPGRPGSRKNFSFTNDEVRRIDRENQRLLHELSRPSPRPNSSTASGRTQTSNPVHPARVYHTTLNRQRQQLRIERENLAFLKRLEGVKATPGLRRTDQLADHQRQASYLGPSRSSSSAMFSFTSSTPLLGPSLRTARPPSRVVTAKGLCTASAGHRRTRTPERDHHTSTNSTTPTSTHAPRSQKGTPRPDWC